VISEGLRLPSTTAILPALNEERSIGAVLQAIPRDIVTEVIVVDGGSADGTAAVAEAHGAKVLRESRRGYGRACALGAAAARGEALVFLDADGAADPRDIAGLLAPIARDEADLVLGSRLTGAMAGGAMPWHQRFGNRVSALLLRLLYGLPLTDLAPFRAVRRGLLTGMALDDSTYGWPTEMIVKAARAKWRITEVPVSCHPRTGGRSKISGTVRGSIFATSHILWTIARHARG
jgi:glycosyltransferase involved in cell wall biosynthesis